VLLVVIGPVMENRRIRFSIPLEHGGSSAVGRGRAGYGVSENPILHNRWSVVVAVLLVVVGPVMENRRIRFSITAGAWW